MFIQTQIITDNPYTFLVSEEHVGTDIEIKLVPISQIMKLYNVEVALCCGLTGDYGTPRVRRGEGGVRCEFRAISYNILCVRFFTIYPTLTEFS